MFDPGQFIVRDFLFPGRNHDIENITICFLPG